MPLFGGTVKLSCNSDASCSDGTTREVSVAFVRLVGLVHLWPHLSSRFGRWSVDWSISLSRLGRLPLVSRDSIFGIARLARWRFAVRWKACASHVASGADWMEALAQWIALLESLHWQHWPTHSPLGENSPAGESAVSASDGARQ